MKPIIIYAAEQDGYIRIKKEELERLINEAYEGGKADVSSITASRPYNFGDFSIRTTTAPLELKSLSDGCEGGLHLTFGNGGDING